MLATLAAGFTTKKVFQCLMLQRHLNFLSAKLFCMCLLIKSGFFKKKKFFFNTALPTQGYPLHCMGHKDTHQLRTGEAAFSLPAIFSPTSSC